MFAPAPGVVPNLFGACGILGNFAWPLFHRRESMLVAQATACAFFTAHFVLIGATTGAVMTTFAGLQAVLAIPLGTRPGFRLVYLLTLPLTAAAVMLTWHGIPSLFAAIGLTLTSLGRYQTAVLRFRTLILASIPAWSLHNFLVGSIPGLLSDAMTLSSGGWMLLGIYRRQRLVQTQTSRDGAAMVEP
jgi:hypothetical protein